MAPQRPWQSGQLRDMAPPPHSAQSGDQRPAPQSAPQLAQMASEAGAPGRRIRAKILVRIDRFMTPCLSHNAAAE
jgi:hypothetical protein